MVEIRVLSTTDIKNIQPVVGLGISEASTVVSSGDPTIAGWNILPILATGNLHLSSVSIFQPAILVYRSCMDPASLFISPVIGDITQLTD